MAMARLQLDAAAGVLQSCPLWRSRATPLNGDYGREADLDARDRIYIRFWRIASFRCDVMTFWPLG
jgi:hypothetical protein